MMPSRLVVAVVAAVAFSWPHLALGQSWTAPRTWVTGELVSASIMNTHVRDNLTVLRTGALTDLTVTSAAGELELTANDIRFGPTVYTADYSTVAACADCAYLVFDKDSTGADTSIVLRDQGNARAELGLVSDNDFHVKLVTGTYPSETFTDYLLIRTTGQVDAVNGGAGDPLLRSFQATGTPALVVGNSDLSTGAGVEVTYNHSLPLAAITVIERGNVYRDLDIAAQNIRFFTGSASVTEFMRIASDGEVGIHTTVPAGQLVVHDTGAGANELLIQNTDTGLTSSDGFSLDITAAEVARVWQYENLDLQIGTNNTTRMIVEAGGDVEIENDLEFDGDRGRYVQFLDGSGAYVGFRDIGTLADTATSNLDLDTETNPLALILVFFVDSGGVQEMCELALFGDDATTVLRAQGHASNTSCDSTNNGANLSFYHDGTDYIVENESGAQVTEVRVLYLGGVPTL